MTVPIVSRRRFVQAAVLALAAVPSFACGALNPPTATPEPTPAPSPTPAAVGRTFALEPGQSELVLKVQEQFAGDKFTTDAVLRTKEISGQLILLPDGGIGEGSKFTVDMKSLESDRSMRDSYIKASFVLGSTQFPRAEFVPKELGGLARPLPVSGALDGQLAGDLTIRDVTRPVTFDFKGMLEGSTFKGTGLTSIKITDVGVALPRVPAVASIEDLARLEVNLVAHAR